MKAESQVIKLKIFGKTKETCYLCTKTSREVENQALYFEVTRTYMAVISLSSVLSIWSSLQKSGGNIKPKIYI